MLERKMYSRRIGYELLVCFNGCIPDKYKAVKKTAGCDDTDITWHVKMHTTRCIHRERGVQQGRVNISYWAAFRKGRQALIVKSH